MPEEVDTNRHESILMEAPGLIHLTSSALKRIRNYQDQHDLNAYCLRLFVTGGGCAGLQYGMAFDEHPRQDDLQLHIQDLDLVIDPTSYPYIEGATIDYVEDLMHGGFQIINPNAVAACSCGTSFRPKEDPNDLSSRERHQDCGCH